MTLFLTYYFGIKSAKQFKNGGLYDNRNFKKTKW
jgi:hypothetical protein